MAKNKNIPMEEQAFEHSRSLKGMLADYVRRPLSEKEWPKVRAEAWAQALEEDWKRKDEEA